MILPSKENIELFKRTPGAISVCESIAIMNIAAQAPEGIYLECGSNAGKAAMSAASGLKKGIFYMVDPIYDLTNLEAWKHSQYGHPDKLAWGYVNEPDFYDNVKASIRIVSGLLVEPVLMGDYSENAIPKYDNYSYVFIDADNHQSELVFAEIKLLEDRIIQGGIIAFHDFNNQFIAPQEAHKYLIETGKYENIEINWKEIFDYVRENNLEENNNSWHEKGSNEFPCYVGAVKRK